MPEYVWVGATRQGNGLDWLWLSQDNVGTIRNSVDTIGNSIENDNVGTIGNSVGTIGMAIA